MKYKVVHISELESMGWEFEYLPYILYGTGPYITVEYSDEIGWFPWCGLNRFKTKHEAEETIKLRILHESL